VGIFVAEKWVDSVVSVKRHSKRVLILKMVLDNGLLNVLMVYAPHSGKPEEVKENFCNEVFHLVRCVPQNEMVMLAGDMNGHVGSSNVGYDGTHGGIWYGDRNADGSRILEFADRLNLVICNTLFMEQESQMVTYAAGPVESMVNYIIARQEDKAKVHNVKVIPNEECVPNHKLLVMDNWTCSLIQQKDGVRSLNQECIYGSSRRKRHEEYQSIVKDKVAEAEWKYLDVNEHWQ